MRGIHAGKRHNIHFNSFFNNVSAQDILQLRTLVEDLLRLEEGICMYDVSKGAAQHNSGEFVWQKFGQSVLTLYSYRSFPNTV